MRMRLNLFYSAAADGGGAGAPQGGAPAGGGPNLAAELARASSEISQLRADHAAHRTNDLLRATFDGRTWAGPMLRSHAETIFRSQYSVEVDATGQAYAVGGGQRQPLAQAFDSWCKTQGGNYLRSTVDPGAG